MTLTDIASHALTARRDPPEPIPMPLASWLSRAGALGLDVLPGAAVLATATLVGLSVPLRGGWWWACVGLGAAAVLWTGFNRLLSPGTSGQSLGRRAFGITLVRRDGSVVGPATLLMRDAAHLVDTAPAFLGWLWPLKDRRRRTLADVMAGTEVRAASSPEAPRGARRRAGIVALAAAAVCAVAGIVSVTVVARQDASVTDTSAAITGQGPRIVEQVLSYYPDTLQADFARAQSLVTDAYRGQLTDQQQTVRNAGAVRNEYWVTNSSVLDATHGRATMLLFLQGQRGAAPDQRYLTATVRVKFIQSSFGPWQVDDLTVVTSPQPIEAKP